MVGALDVCVNYRAVCLNIYNEIQSCSELRELMGVDVYFPVKEHSVMSP